MAATALAVVREILRVRVVNLELQVLRRPLSDAESHTAIKTARARLDGRERADAVAAVGAETDAPRRSEKRIVAVDEAGDVGAFRVVVLHQHRVVGNDFLLPRETRRRRARILEVLVEDEDVGMIGIPNAGRVDQLRIVSESTTESRPSAAIIAPTTMSMRRSGGSRAT